MTLHSYKTIVSILFKSVYHYLHLVASRSYPFPIHQGNKRFDYKIQNPHQLLSQNQLC